jgi:type IV pilus assembly protein PilY1
MDPPSLDPPPDADYPAFIDANKNRRTMIWVGANDGMLHAIDGRLGKEVWAFVPLNLLPKLRALQSGQPIGDFRYFVDGSPKVADVKVSGAWRSYLVMGEGSGGTFYQTFDVTLDNIAGTVGPDSDDLGDVLGYFASATSVPLKWAFPSYSHFDATLGTWGDVASSAPEISKTVGETWSDPAVGQIESATGRFVVLTGSGFFRYSQQQQAHRAGVVAGSRFYLLDAADGSVLDSADVGNDGLAEDVDSCVAANDCRKLKNALQADPVATGPPDSRFITKVYLGDLDGRIWRFDVGLDAALVPTIKQTLKLYTVDSGVGPANEHPMFASMATVNVGSASQYLFVGTGSDLLPQNSVNTRYALIVVLDQGTTGSRTGLIQLEATDGVNGDEKVSAFPAVAGDIVFFSTTTYQASACLLPDANLYAFTFIGGAAYDTTGDDRITTGVSGDSTKVRTTTGARATAPFIVDQHLVFGTGGNIEMFGDPSDFNNGVGQAGVRILSWREVR